MTPALVISGGQTGADIGGLRAALSASIRTGGWAPRGWETEDGPNPTLSSVYGLVEHSGGYRERTLANVKWLAEVEHGYGCCLWFGNPYSSGGKLTIGECERAGVETYTVVTAYDAHEAADWIFGTVGLENSVPVVLMIAGNRESKSPGIGAKVETFCAAMFARLKEMA